MLSTVTSSAVSSVHISFRVFNTVKPGSMSLYLQRLADNGALRRLDDVLSSTDTFKNIPPRGLNIELMVMATQRDALNDAWRAGEGGWERFVTEKMSWCRVRGLLRCTQYVHSSHTVIVSDETQLRSMAGLSSLRDVTSSRFIHGNEP